ncbi:MAG TPA: glycosyltransferase family 2 protein [Candidatus Methanoperedens sp.]|nr:glycosyltransferase family 2 protein [Candidatus Methanoperedens sp.]
MGEQAGGPRVSVVIPVLNAEPYLPALLAAFAGQSPRPPDEVIIVDSGSTDGTAALAAGAPGVRFFRTERFSHGRARNEGARAAGGDVVVFLSQDALPADGRWLAELLVPFSDPRVAAAYSRQVPRPGANPMERHFLEDRFPAGEPVARAGGAGELSLEQVFFSNVSSAVRRETLLAHPFDEELIMSEDQQLSRDLLAAGLQVVYRPSSAVLHSHNYTLWSVFRRYFDSVYSLTVIFRGHTVSTSLGMGARYAFAELAYMLRRHPLWLPYYSLYFAAKSLGTLFGHVAEALPRPVARALSFHRYHWDARR